MAFDQVEPDPTEVTMHLTAQLLALFHNVHRDRKAKPRPYEPLDFLPHLQEREAVIANTSGYNAVIAAMRSNYAQRTGRKN